MRILFVCINNIGRADMTAVAFSKKFRIYFTRIVCVLLVYKLYCIRVGWSVGTDLVGELS